MTLYSQLKYKQAFIDPKDNQLYVKLDHVVVIEIPQFYTFEYYFEDDYEVIPVNLQFTHDKMEKRRLTEEIYSKEVVEDTFFCDGATSLYKDFLKGKEENHEA